MIETSDPAINAKALMARVREVTGSKMDGLILRKPPASKRLSMVQLPRLPVRRQAAGKKSIYQLNELLVLYDEAFVDNAYETLLRRKADRQGRRNFLEQLRAGSVSRIEVLGRLRYSREGRQQAVSVAGLFGEYAKTLTFRVPVLGPLFEVMVVLARLPARLRHLAFLQEQTMARIVELERQFNLLSQQSEAAVNRLISELNRPR